MVGLLVEAEFVGDTPRERRGDPGDESLRKTILEEEQRGRYGRTGDRESQ